MQRRYDNANQAFEDLYEALNALSVDGSNTKRVLNHGFYLNHPLENIIVTPWRNWSMGYAMDEWDWYRSENTNVLKLAERAKRWLQVCDDEGNVNSNYGFHWMRSWQLHNIIQLLIKDPKTRQAWLTIYDGKQREHSPCTNNGFALDTPCTLNIGFMIDNGHLNMMVHMRSNDLWWGFCNDQFCFSMLQDLVATAVNLPVGWYYHHAADLHLYPDFFNRNKTTNIP